MTTSDRCLHFRSQPELTLTDKMNNSQFRALLDPSGAPSQKGGDYGSKPKLGAPALGSRNHSSIPMTPRAVARGGNDFARQVTEYKWANSQKAGSKAKSKPGSVPKGTKFSSEYQDRAALLRDDQTSTEADPREDQAERLKALEEMVKLQQIDQATFEKLRGEMGIGGEIGTTHMVKGLDWKLLERVKRGEDVMTTKPEKVEESTADDNPAETLESELDNVLQAEVIPVERKDTPKTGHVSTDMDMTKMSRNEILRHLRKSRAAARESSEATPDKTEPELGLKFRKIGGQNQEEKKKLIEIVNGRRREVLVITKADGTTKRKVRWLDKANHGQENETSTNEGQVLGMEVPEHIAAKHKALLDKQKQVEDEEDIFADAGIEYDPIGENAEQSDETDANDSDNNEPKEPKEPEEAKGAGDGRRNYFSTKPTEEEEPRKPELDPSIIAALKRAAILRKAQENGDAKNVDGNASRSDKDFLERLKKREREDAEDLDMGFGESRFGDDDDEGPVWDDEAEGEAKGKGKKAGRKRGPKKRKGNKDDASDVMAVLNKRKV